MLLKTVFAICKFTAIYQTVIIAFLSKRCYSKSVYQFNLDPYTTPHYLLHFGSEKIGPRAIKLAFTLEVK